MKVLFIYYEPQPSGQTTHVLSLVRGLDRRRYQLVVVLPEELESSAATFEQSGARVVPLPLRKALWPPRAILALVRLIRKLEPDIVHVHSQEAGLVARVVARLAGARVVLYTPQTVDIRRAGLHRLYTWTERILARVTDLIVSVVEADRARMIRWGVPAHKIVTVPNGIELDRFEGPVNVVELRKSLGVAAGRPLVIQMGRLREQKDPLSFVEGAARVVRQRSDVQFVLLGDGPLRTEVEARVRDLDLEDHVHLAGWRDDAYRLLAAADVVTLTSRWEGTPYALLEAMAWSLPVVATAVNGCPEVVREAETGFLVPPGDATTWAEKVIEVLADPTRASTMGRQGRNHVEARFTLQQMVTRIEELYHQAV